MRHNRFSCLLATLLLMMVVSPFVSFFRTSSFPLLAPILTTLLFSAVLIFAVYAVSRRRLDVVVARSWAMSVIAVQVLHAFLQWDVVLVVHNGLAVGLLAYTLFLLFQFLFSEQQVTIEVISASICGYLLLGFLWALLYSLLNFAQPNSFSFSYVDGELLSNGPLTLRFGTERSATALYFSYATLTTLGYGDIVPATMTARMLCSVEAIVGQMYVAVLIGRLVGLHIAHEKRSSSS
jgi:voltage-gated potassium channel